MTTRRLEASGTGGGRAAGAAYRSAWPLAADQVWSGQIRRVEWAGFGQRMEKISCRPERTTTMFSFHRSRRPMGFGSGILGLSGPRGGHPARPQSRLRADPGGVLSRRRRDDRPDAGFHRPDRTQILAHGPDQGSRSREAIIRPHNPGQPASSTSRPSGSRHEPRHRRFQLGQLARGLAVAEQRREHLSGRQRPAATRCRKPAAGPAAVRRSPGYKFFLFPDQLCGPAGPSRRNPPPHRAVLAAEMPHQALRQQFAAAPRFARDLDQALALFDRRISTWPLTGT